jgi:hypothetical protein
MGADNTASLPATRALTATAWAPKSTPSSARASAARS